MSNQNLGWDYQIPWDAHTGENVVPKSARARKPKDPLSKRLLRSVQAAKEPRSVRDTAHNFRVPTDEIWNAVLESKWLDVRWIDHAQRCGPPRRVPYVVLLAKEASDDDQ